MRRDSALLQVALLNFLLFFIFTRLSNASQYTVGDSSDWNLNVDYSTWAAKYSFKVSDTLLFIYNAEEHNVYQVSQANYGSCSTLNPIKTYDDGNTVVALAEATTYYFICGIPGHCGQGMKVAINVTSTPPASTPTSTPPPPTSTPPQAKTPTSTPPPTSTPTSPPITTPTVPPASASSPTPSSSPTLSPTPAPFISPTPSPSSSKTPSLAPSTPSTTAVLPPPSTPPSPTSSSLPSPKVVASFTILLGALLLILL